MQHRLVWAIVSTIVFTALMVGFGMIVKPVIGVSVDWLAARIGIGWVWALLIVLIVPFGLWGWWDTYRTGRAARPRSP